MTTPTEGERNTRRNCWTCEHKTTDGLCLAAPTVPGVVQWTLELPGEWDKKTRMPPLESDGCPGYAHVLAGG